MNRQEKQELIQSLKHNFESSQASFIVGVKGLTVEEVRDLRKSLRSEKGILKVAKNTLFKKAAEQVSGLNELEPYFKNQIGIVFAKDNSPAIAKILFNSASTIPSLELVAGSLDHKLIQKGQIQYLATLPPREVLLAKLAGTLKMPIANFASVLSQLMQRLLIVLKKIEEQKQQN